MTARELIAVLVATLSMLGMAVSMAVLIFSGPLSDGLPRAIAAFAIGGAISAVWAGLRSTIVPAATIIQDGPAIVLVAIAASLATPVAPDSVANVFVLLGLSSVLTGATMWLLGRFRLGGLARYVPTTVVGAFMAGTGWLLTKGGFEVMVGFGLGLGTVSDLFTPDAAKFWIPGFLIGLVAWLIGRSNRIPPTAISLVIVGAVAGFYAVVALWSSVDAVESGGWLIGPFPAGAGPSLVSAGELRGADWGSLALASPSIASVVAVSVLPLLLNVTGLGLRSGERVDLDAELRTAGVANMAIGPLGCAPGFIAVSSTVLLEKVGAHRRVVPVLAGLLMAIFGVVGVEIVGYVPRLVVGAILVTVGVALLADWAVALSRSVDRIEQLLSTGILVVIALLGILPGIVAGVAAICMVFIVRSSRVDPVRIASTGGRRRSRVDRPIPDLAHLRERADRLAVFELHGYLFFGSLTSLGDRVEAVTGVDVGSVPGELDAVILDFRSVTGIDTSGNSLLADVVRSLGRRCPVVVMSGVDGGIRTSLEAHDPDAFVGVRWVDTLDEALELTEQAQLAVGSDGDAPPLTTSIGVSPGLLESFEEISVSAGATVLEQGAESDGMFIVVEGVLTAFQIDELDRRHRLRQFGRGTSVGEIGLVTGSPRSAQIVADTDVTALWLSRQAYEAMRVEHPDQALELHEFIMREQASRVVSLSVGLAQASS